MPEPTPITQQVAASATPLQWEQKGEEIESTSNRGYFAANQADTFSPHPIALLTARNISIMPIRRISVESNIKPEHQTPLEEAQQTEPADEKAVKQRRGREVEDHTFAKAWC
ncbi:MULTISPECIES: hypothetical protein [Mesorhizobium]|uniref:hypothetical protein n=1 Tax=Mesorhizobium TaxID=68287 RepID=UPI000BB08A76|nr:MULTISPECIES: hypothetical protein [Mesorhizobium]PBB29721.1 hypothetical protein CK214_23380 [Mesorhizobium sp. WSM3882]PBB39646.1 hypothetical protein CK221_02180 [Mesorhizobium sp. WSM3868]PBB40577.1 hypothetical protein CK222_27415 [Mesorhizobium sp. WSM3866]PBB59141.1 hypothetical protein CK217_26340 [Mesorhizobium loti]PBB80176.1 hypothetical protein CK218_16280 [Mesorhizobium sp. WSM3879]